MSRPLAPASTCGSVSSRRVPAQLSSPVQAIARRCRAPSRSCICAVGAAHWRQHAAAFRTGSDIFLEGVSELALRAVRLGSGWVTECSRHFAIHDGALERDLQMLAGPHRQRLSVAGYAVPRVLASSAFRPFSRSLRSIQQCAAYPSSLVGFHLPSALMGSAASASQNA